VAASGRSAAGAGNVVWCGGRCRAGQVAESGAGLEPRGEEVLRDIGVGVAASRPAPI
jgi:hypothetical protein